MTLPIQPYSAREAWDKISTFQDDDLSNKAKQLLINISKSISILKKAKIDLDHLPSIHAAKTDDDAIILEWISKIFRIGLSIERNDNESSWYVVFNDRENEFNTSGYLKDSDVNKLLTSLILVVNKFC